MSEPDVVEVVSVVRVPPYISPDLSDGESYCVYEKWLYSRATDAQSATLTDICKGAKLPTKSSPAVLYVKLDDKDDITLNGGSLGKLSYIKYSLTDRLAEIFREREVNNMYEPNSTILEKTVHIQMEGENRSYADLLTIVDAVQQSGARAIVLVLNDEVKYLENRPKYVVRNKITTSAN